MIPEDFHLSIAGASLLELATLLEAIATELKNREMRLHAAALRIDADNLRRYHRISVRASWGNLATDAPPPSPREEAQDERKR